MPRECGTPATAALWVGCVVLAGSSGQSSGICRVIKGRGTAAVHGSCAWNATMRLSIRACAAMGDVTVLCVRPFICVYFVCICGCDCVFVYVCVCLFMCMCVSMWAMRVRVCVRVIIVFCLSVSRFAPVHPYTCARVRMGECECRSHIAASCRCQCDGIAAEALAPTTSS